MVDDSQQKIAALERDFQRFHRFIQICPNGIAVCDDRKIVSANPSLEKMLQAAAGDLPGSLLETYLPEEGRRCTIQLLDEMLLSGQSHEAGFSTRLLRKDGAEIEVTVSVDRIESAQEGDHILVFRPLPAFCRSPLLQKDELLQLAHLRRMAVFGQLAASLLHEMGQPLTAAKGASEMLATHGFVGSDQSDSGRSVQIVTAAVATAAAQFRRAWDFVRARRPEIKVFDAGACVRSAIELCEATVRHAGILLDFQYDEDTLIQADRSLLNLVFVSLIQRSATALHSRGDGGGAIRVECRQPVGRHVEVLISHNGDLLSAEQLVVHEFSVPQPDVSSGLTLSVCRAIVEENGGVLSLQHANDPLRVQYRLMFLQAAQSGA